MAPQISVKEIRQDALCVLLFICCLEMGTLHYIVSYCILTKRTDKTSSLHYCIHHHEISFKKAFKFSIKFNKILKGPSH